MSDVPCLDAFLNWQFCEPHFFYGGRSSTSISITKSIGIALCTCRYQHTLSYTRNAAAIQSKGRHRASGGNYHGSCQRLHDGLVSRMYLATHSDRLAVSHNPHLVRLSLHPCSYDLDPPTSFHLLRARSTRHARLSTPSSTIALLPRIYPITPLLSTTRGLLGVDIPCFSRLPRSDASIQGVPADRSHDPWRLYLGREAGNRIHRANAADQASRAIRGRAGARLP